MARLRTLKPGFFTNDALAELPPLARLLFQGLWCIADREGRLEDRPRRIKAEVLPYDDCDVDDLLTRLAGAGFITRYAVGESRYIQVINFAKHQTPHIKEAASTIPAPGEHQTSTVPAPPVIGIQLLGSSSGEGEPSPPIPPTPMRPDPAPPDGGGQVRAVPKPSTLSKEQRSRFDAWYAAYPNKQHRPDAERAWRKLDPDDDLTARLMRDGRERRAGRKWSEGYIEHPATYLNNRVWEDDIEPVRLTPARASPNGKHANGFLAHYESIVGEEIPDGPQDVPAAIDAAFVVGKAHGR